jgi:hypothetical protein
MPEVDEVLALGNAAIVAPAGHGKTELIAKVAASCRRALVLTHTHAGVQAIRARLKRLGVPYRQASVDTIAGWSMRYAHAFPRVAAPPPNDPRTGQEWDQLYRGPTAAIAVPAITEVVRASYDRILIDEYQDCTPLQHDLAIALSGIVPTVVFGDPMQGIFEFAGATLNWEQQIHPTFPLAGSLDVPHRWAGANPALGAWVAETRQRLLRGDEIDLRDPRIVYRVSDDPFDMGTLFEGIDAREGTTAAIHPHKQICYSLACAANGGYQAIEEIAAVRLRQFGAQWDGAANGDAKRRAIDNLRADCFHVLANEEVVEPEAGEIEEALRAIQPRLNDGNGASAAAQLLALSRKHPRWKLFRAELWRDAERAAADLVAERAVSMVAAISNVRQRTSLIGRYLPKRTVSTPLLLKGLEFEHVIVPHGSAFEREGQAQAKLFYVAISRATRTLTIASPQPTLRFPVPRT